MVSRCRCYDDAIFLLMAGKAMANEVMIVEQKEVTFYGDQVVAAMADDGTVFVPVRPLCELLGVSWQGQARKLRSDPVLSDVSMTVNISLQSSATRGKRTSYDMVSLPLDYLNGWLFGINANRVKDGIRPQLIRYQREVYQVLSDAFGRNMVTARPDSDLMESDSPAALAYRNAMELANIARQQFYLEQRIESAENTIAATVARVDAIEAELGNDERQISVSQQMELSQAVKTMAHELGKRSGRNEYQGVYGELHRRFQIPGYKQLPTAKFDEAMGWLRDWYSSLYGDSPF